MHDRPGVRTNILFKPNKMENLDVEKFISLIKSRTSIWDHTSCEYSDKIKRHEDWASVCEEIIPNYAEISNKEKSVIVTELQNKWKVLRDGFTRSLRNHNKKSGSVGTTSRLYKYHVQLLFLKDLLDTKGKRKLNISGNSKLQSEAAPVEILFKRQKHETTERSEETLIEKLTKNVIKRFNNDKADEDKQFLLCLLKDFKRIPDDYKLDAKSDIINTIRHYASKSLNQYHTDSTHQDSPDEKFNVGTTHRPYRQQTIRQSISSPETSNDSKMGDIFSST